jgi:hypothetical protein
MKHWSNLFLLLPVLLLGLLAACDDDMYEDEIYEDEAAWVEDDYCYDGETYDPESDSCVFDIYCETDEECAEILAGYYDEEDWADIDYMFMEEEDCLPGENYDPDESVCYIECDTDEECDALAEEIYAGLDVYFSESFDGGAEVASHGPVPEALEDLSGSDEELPSIARYILNGDLDPQLVGLDTDQAAAYTNQQRHQEIWQFLRRILPTEALQAEVREFHIFTDGEDDTLAYVQPLENDPNLWLIAIDIVDAGTSGKINQPDFVHTVVHEFSHILTLENGQVPPDTSLSAEELEEGIESPVALSCATFYTGEGCANGRSYISQFFDRFWADVYEDEFQDVEWAETDEEYEELLLEFYENYEDWFVTEYAATNPAEDIAESFTYFVLQEKPAGDTVAEEKVLFFYDYPELVSVRTHIRSELARMK